MTGDAKPDLGPSGTASALIAVARASEWWEFKLVPPLAIAYATCLMVGASPWQGVTGLF